jgi:hypothetical protein
MIAWRASQVLLDAWLPGFHHARWRLNVNSKLGLSILFSRVLLLLLFCFLLFIIWF